MKKNLYFVMGIAILPHLALAEVKEDVQPVDTTLSLQELTVRAHFVEQNKTPLNLTTITPADIRLHATASNYLEMFQGIPGVYATASTGSYGDATLNMRGFKQDNISIMLNGIPIQGLTSGSMYWSNWMGLGDATYSVQVQKGMGGSMLADCAMGGMVNIITKNSNALPHTEFGVSTNAWGVTKGSLGYSTGLFSNGWSVDLNLSYVKGNGYVKGTNIETFSYMLSVSKILDETNTLIFTALGSPERHNQRNTELTSQEVETYGRDYSKNWGFYQGKEFSIGRNHYAKPYFTLQHLKEGERISMKNSLYLAIADGGGYSTYAATGAKSIIQHRTADSANLIDFDAVIAENTSDGISKNILIDYLSGHTQAGAIVSADYQINIPWKLSAGLQYQYYDTWSKMEVLDLFGGEYFSLYGGKYKVGDYIGSRYGRTTHHISGFAQGTYTSEKLTARFGISIFNGNYRRHNDENGEKSEWASGMGASFKGGILWNVNKNNVLYLNAGYNSRLPYANTYLASSNLTITNDIVNEKNIMAEAGWRPKWHGGGMEMSAYIASWKDKTMSVSLQSKANEQKENYLVTGLDALHMGLELSAYQRLTSWLTAKAYVMTASWKWKSSGTAHIYDKYSNDELYTYTSYCDGLHVGDAPQTQIGAQLDAKLRGGFYLHAGWQCNSRMYADFEPSSRTSETDKSDSYRIPTYNLLDATFGWEGEINRAMRLNIFATGSNLLDANYIERGLDGATHDLGTFRGYWGQARTVSLGFRLSM